MKALSAMLLSFSLMSQVFAHPGAVTKAKAAELGSHRVGRLVDTGKADASFFNNMSEINVSDIPHTAENQPAYKVVVKQPADQMGMQNALTILLDLKGKFLSAKAAPLMGSDTMVWPDASPAEIFEGALHALTEQSPEGINLKPFNDGLTSIALKQQVSDDGSIKVIATVISSEVQDTLEIVLDTAGKLVSMSVKSI